MREIKCARGHAVVHGLPTKHTFGQMGNATRDEARAMLKAKEDERLATHVVVLAK
jgi:hypothetical protein